jgi:hypothetical protein
MRISAQTHYSFTERINAFRNGNPSVYAGLTLPYRMSVVGKKVKDRECVALMAYTVWRCTVLVITHP